MNVIDRFWTRWPHSTMHGLYYDCSPPKACETKNQYGTMLKRVQNKFQTLFSLQLNI